MSQYNFKRLVLILIAISVALTVLNVMSGYYSYKARVENEEVSAKLDVIMSINREIKEKLNQPIPYEITNGE